MTTRGQNSLSSMSRMERLAAFLVIVGEDSAAQIMRTLPARDLEKVSLAITKVPMLSHKQQESIIREFSALVVQSTSSVRGSNEFTQATLEKSVGISRASYILGQVSTDRVPEALLRQIFELEVLPLGPLLAHEPPQTVALISSYVSPGKAAEILGCLDENLREEVVERMATMSIPPIGVVKKVVSALKARLADRDCSKGARELNGAKTAADVLNALDRTRSKEILVGIEDRDPELVSQIRDFMFTFEDLENLNNVDLQKIMREVDLSAMARALKPASSSLKQKLYAAISKRAAKAVEEEIDLMGSVKRNDIEEAQKSIVAIVRKMEAEGVIELNKDEDA
jgi:flagellar motor switch protein FliG